MTDEVPVACEECGSSDVRSDEVVEDGCGHVAPASRFEEGSCPKCRASVRRDELDRVGTMCTCLDCGNRFDDSRPVDAADDPAGAVVTFPTLPEPGDDLSWLPDRFVPESAAGKRVFGSVVVLVILTSGVTGAAFVSPYLQAAEYDDGQVATNQTWQEYETIVMVRNDDVQPWYERKTLRKLDRIFVDAGVPVTHGVIPTTEGSNAISRNGPLCDYLRSLRTEHPDTFEIALHGYTHEQQTDFYGGSEFGRLPPATQREWLRSGHGILTDCLGAEPDTFIPPMNTYDANTTAALDGLGYTTVSGAAWFTNQYYNESTSFRAGGLVHAPQYPDASMLNWTAGEPDYRSQAALRDSFDDAYRRNEPYVFMIHYFTFSEPEHFDRLRSFLEYVQSKPDVKFMTIGEFGRGLESGEIRRTDDGWRVLEPTTDGRNRADSLGGTAGVEVPSVGGRQP